MSNDDSDAYPVSRSVKSPVLFAALHLSEIYFEPGCVGFIIRKIILLPQIALCCLPQKKKHLSYFFFFFNLNNPFFG